jgi:hypothetical protein
MNKIKASLAGIGSVSAAVPARLQAGGGVRHRIDGAQRLRGLLSQADDALESCVTRTLALWLSDGARPPPERQSSQAGRFTGSAMRYRLSLGRRVNSRICPKSLSSLASGATATDQGRDRSDLQALWLSPNSLSPKAFALSPPDNAPRCRAAISLRRSVLAEPCPLAPRPSGHLACRLRHLDRDTGGRELV